MLVLTLTYLNDVYMWDLSTHLNNENFTLDGLRMNIT